MKIAIKIQNYQVGYTIRRFIRTTFPFLSQTLIHKALRTGDIVVNNKKTSLDYILQTNDQVSIWDKLTIPAHTSEVSQKHEYRFLQDYLIAKTADMWVFNKPQGLAMQGGTNLTTSLDYLLSGWMEQDYCTPHLVHRLDKNTSGVCLVATSSHAANELAQLFARKQIHKTYIAVCQNKTNKQFMLNQTGSFVNDIDGKKALTHYTIKGIDIHNKTLVIAFEPITGRKHQIRLHASGNDLPILGDIYYNDDCKHALLHLHAYKITSKVDTELFPIFTYQAELPKHLAYVAPFFLE